MVVVYVLDNVRSVVVKCNPKNARVRTIEDNERMGKAGVLWNIPYRLLEPHIASSLSTEMVMRSFEQPENEGIKTYVAKSKNADDPFDFPEGSPEFYIAKAICELWHRLDDENLERECQAEMEMESHKPGSKRRPSTIMRDVQLRYSSMINKMFSALGREISKSAALRWENIRKQEMGSIQIVEAPETTKGKS